MSQPPSSWDPHAGQDPHGQRDQPGQGQYPQAQYGQGQYPQGQYGQGQYGAQQQPYTPPPQYGGYPPPAYGQPSYGAPQYGAPYGMPTGPQRPGAALAAAVLAYIQAGLVLICSFVVLAAGAAAAEPLVIGIIQLVSVGLLVFGGVQLTGGSGRMLMVIANAVQLVLVIYYLIRFAPVSDVLDLDGGGLFVIPLIFGVMPAIALGLTFTAAVTRFLVEKQQRPPQNQQWTG